MFAYFTIFCDRIYSIKLDMLGGSGILKPLILPELDFGPSSSFPLDWPKTLKPHHLWANIISRLENLLDPVPSKNLEEPTSKNNNQLYTIVCHKSDVIATVMETDLQNVTFMRDFVSPGVGSLRYRTLFFGHW